MEGETVATVIVALTPNMHYSIEQRVFIFKEYVKSILVQYIILDSSFSETGWIFVSRSALCCKAVKQLYHNKENYYELKLPARA